MTLNDLELQKWLFLVIFCIFGCRKVNCDEMDEDRPDQDYLRTGTGI